MRRLGTPVGACEFIPCARTPRMKAQSVVRRGRSHQTGRNFYLLFRKRACDLGRPHGSGDDIMGVIAFQAARGCPKPLSRVKMPFSRASGGFDGCRTHRDRVRRRCPARTERGLFLVNKCPKNAANNCTFDPDTGNCATPTQGRGCAISNACAAAPATAYFSRRQRRCNKSYSGSDVERGRGRIAGKFLETQRRPRNVLSIMHE